MALCDGVARFLVVWHARLPPGVSERSLQARWKPGEGKLWERYHMENVDKLGLLAEIHRNEDETIQHRIG